MEALGHEAKLIAPQYVHPFVKRQKNDAADAEAIAFAARQPEMRFVVAETVEQNLARQCFAVGSDWSIRRLKTSMPYRHCYMSMAMYAL
ncbi:hypothetical protein [uncultured Ruegeria sp.]|uniref:hypothetical protein n=1 Tax=uncultured Ruegeria sp. TaxID=259304 RepID=UPI0026104108|nr:hypothetical protein [uncultured Ruegeria sp.]